MDLFQIEDLRVRVSQRHKAHALVRKETEAAHVDRFLSATQSSDTGKGTGGLARHGSLLPEATARVHKGLDLRRHGSEASTETEQDTVILGHLVGSDDGMILFRRSTHLAQDLVGQGLGDLINVARGSGGFDAFGDRLGHGSHVAVEGVVDDGDFGGHGCFVWC